MIELREVVRHFGEVCAVDHVSFDAPQNAITGFLGPNGAGKSTVLKMISTWLPPTAGTLRVLGRDVVHDSMDVRRLLGYLTEHNALYDVMRVRALVEFVASAHGLGRSRRRERLEFVHSALELGPVWERRVGECSKGFRRRVGLACAIVHDPPVLLLDEPTEGLDPLQVDRFRELLRELSPGRTILFSSHILAEVEAVCDRVVVLQEGRVLADHSLDELRERAEGKDRSLERCVLQLFRDADRGQR